MTNGVVPEDIKPAWFSVIRRLQSVARSDGLSIITISVLVDSTGDPKAWIAPVVKHIEPKNASSAILSLVTPIDRV